MFGIGTTEIAIILILCLIIFGASRLPQIGKSLGEGIKEFKKAGKEVKKDIEEGLSDEEEKKVH